MRFPAAMRQMARCGVLGAALVSGRLLSGCTTTADGKVYWMGDEPKTDAARQELQQQQAQRDAAVLKNQLAGIEQAQARLVERLDRLESQSRENTKLRDDLAAMRRDLDQARSEREAMRKEIVDDLTTRINKYMASVTAASSASHSAATTKQNGYMHTVVAGQKLADIAKAYKTTSAAIRKANNLKDDNLKAGQSLFIPE